MLSCNLFMMTCNYWSCMSIYQSSIWRRIMSQGFPVESFQVALSWKVPGLAHEASASKGSRFTLESEGSTSGMTGTKTISYLAIMREVVPKSTFSRRTKYAMCQYKWRMSWSLYKCCGASFPEFTIPEGVGGWRILFRLSHP